MAETILPAEPQELEPGPRPRLSRLRAWAGLLLLAVMIGGIWAFGYWEPRLLPVRVIEVQGELHHHSSELLQEMLAKRLRGGFLTADLADLKRGAEELAWVGGASIRRIWPDRLQVRVNEHKPVARWNGEGLVTAEGVVFRPRTGTVPAGLPMLEGDEQRARELVQRYLKWRDELMLAGHLIDSLAVDARGAWRVDLVSKTRLELGTSEIEQRLARFIGAAPQLDAAGRQELVDLRYSNGFAVRWARTLATQTPIQEPPQPTVAAQRKVQSGAKAASQTRSKAKPRTPANSERKSQAPAKAKTPPKSQAGGKLPTSPKAPPKAQQQTRPTGPAQPAARALTQVAPARPAAKPQERSDKRG